MNDTNPNHSPNSWFRILPLLCLLSVSSIGLAQPLLQWDQGYGGEGWEQCNSAVQTNDLGYMLVGSTETQLPTGNVDSLTRDDLSLPFWYENFTARGDYWVLRIDEDGNELWSTRLGGERKDIAWGVIETNDGGFLVGGESWSDVSGDKTEPSRGDADYWIVKLDANGQQQWDRTYGGDSIDQMNVVIQTLDGGFIIGGHSFSGGWTVADSTGEKSDSTRGALDWWVIKTDNLGNIEWEQTYGGTLRERLTDIVQKADGTYLVTGGTESPPSGEVDSLGRGEMDYWMLHLDPLGNELDEYRYGSDQYDELNKVVVSSDGTYVLAGSSYADVVSGDKTDPGFSDASDLDWWIMKIDPITHNILWQHTFGGSSIENVYSLSQNSVDHYLLGGFTFSTDGTLADNTLNGQNDFWIMYLDPNGDRIWDEVYGGDQAETLEQIFQTNDGGYLMAGHSSSDVSGDKSDPTEGLNDFWVVKTLCNVNVSLNDTIVCPGEEVTISAYDPNCQGCIYSWSDNNSITDSIRMITPQDQVTFGVTLTDGVGCQREDEITVSTHTPPMVDLGADVTICPGDPHTIEAGNSGLDILWNTNETTPSIVANYPGRYVVSVTDAIGCTTPDSIEVAVSELFAYVETTNTSCGENNGAATVIASGGTGTYSYTWIAGGNSATITDLARGEYAVVVDDGNCTFVAKGIVGFEEPPIVEWEQNYGGSQEEVLNDVLQTPDGGYIAVGSTTSADGDLTANFGGRDFWVKKLNASGMIEWQRDYGGSEDDVAYSVALTSTGGYIVAGSSASANGDVNFNLGGLDVWVLALDATGTILWSQGYGGSGNDEGLVIKNTWEGGYILASRTDSPDGNVTDAFGANDIWILKLSANGFVEWQQSYGGPAEDFVADVEQTSDGGYFIGAYSTSAFPANHGGYDFTTLKVNPRGVIEWQNHYGGSADDLLNDILPTNDGGFLLAGRTASNNTDVIGSNGGDDCWLVKVDAGGTLVWQSPLGGPLDEGILSVSPTSDGNYLVLSSGLSANGDFAGNNGLNDLHLLKVNDTGNVIWSQNYGSTQEDFATIGFQTRDGAYLIAGNSNGSDTDVSANFGMQDDWMVKLRPPLIPDVVLPADPTICAFDTANIAPAITNCLNCSWSWTDGNTDSLRLVNPMSTTTYEINIIDQYNCTSSDQITVNVNPLPIVNLSDTESICEDASFTLDAGNDGVNYQWSTAESTPMITVDTSGTYVVTVTDNIGCRTLDSTELIVNPLPIVDLGNDTSFCEGVIHTLDAENPGASFQWSNGGGNTASIAVSSTDTYGVTVTDSNNCSAEDEVTVNFNALPQPVTVDALDPGPHCPGTVFTISIPDSEVGVQYELFDGNTIVGSTVTGNGGLININTDEVFSTATFEVVASFGGFCPDTLSASTTAFIGDVEAPMIDCRADTVFTIQNGDCNPALALAAPANVTDNCGLERLTYSLTGATLANSPNNGIQDASGETYNIGLTSITYVAVDSFGNSSTCSFDVEVVDQTEPLVGTAAADLMVECDGMGNAAAFTTWLADHGGATAVDDCSPLTWSTIPAAPIIPDACGETGSIEVTFVAADSSGNSVFTTATFTIEDTQAPTFTVPNDIVINPTDDPLDLSLTGDVIDEADNCDGGVSDQGPRFASFTDVMQVEDCEDVITRTWTLTDECGNTNTQQQIIRIAYPIPSATLGGATVLCEGETATLTFDLSGGTTYNVSYTDGDQTFTLNGISDGHTIDVTPSSTTTYTINSVLSLDRIGCEGTVTGDAPITVYEIPEAINVETTCNLLNTAYEVTFEISGGVAGTYSVVGDAGTLNGNQFTSNTIPRDSVYTFILFDANACDSTIITGSYDCACTTESGYIEENTLTVCGDEVLSATHLGDTLDNNDLVEFVVHDGDAMNIGTILYTTNTPEFSYQTGMQYGVIYYVTIIAGTDDGSGNVADVDACYSESVGVPITFEEPPTAVISTPEGTVLDCIDNSLHLSGGNSQTQGGIEFAWTSDAAGNILGDTLFDLVEVSEAGMYFLEITDLATGCTAISSIEIETDEDAPIALIETPDALTCADTIVQLNAGTSSTGNDFTYQWSGGTIESGAQSLTPQVSVATNYTLVVTNEANGCVDSATTLVPLDTVAPVVDAGDGPELDCINTEVMLSGSYVSPASNHTIQWLTDAGVIVSGANTLTPTVSEDGIYSLIVTNLDNGCPATAEVTVTVDPATPTGALFEIIDPECYGDDNGSIAVLDVEGGTEPFEYALNDGPFIAFTDFNRLEEGAYNLTVQDATGCEWDTLINLVSPPELIVDLGENLAIDLGDSIQLNVLVNQDIDGFVWNDPELESMRPYVQPLNQTTYIVEVFADGCVSEDFITVNVRKDRNVYIPNTFTPDGDGINDFFTVFGDQSVTNIRTFQVFDRWGETVFSINNLAPNAELDGWDGRLHDERLPVGVYVYYAEIEFFDGRVELFKGEVTLLR